MAKTGFCKLLSLYLILSMIVLSLPAPGWAMFLPAAPERFDRAADAGAVQKTLESAAVKQRLNDLGLSAEEAMAKVNQLSDEELHQFAAQLDSLNAGGDGLGSVVFVLLIVLLVILILQLSGRQVIIR